MCARGLSKHETPFLLGSASFLLSLCQTISFLTQKIPVQSDYLLPQAPFGSFMGLHEQGHLDAKRTGETYRKGSARVKTQPTKWRLEPQLHKLGDGFCLYLFTSVLSQVCMHVETANLLPIEEYHPCPASDLPVLGSLLLQSLTEVKVALATLGLGSTVQTWPNLYVGSCNPRQD